MAPKRRSKVNSRRKYGGAFKRFKKKSLARSGFFRLPKGKVARDRRQALIDWVTDLKRKPCTDCKRSFETVAMDWDHLPGRGKNFTISQYIREHGHLDSARRLVEIEIGKCELLCACCHRVRTQRRAKTNGFFKRR